MVTCLTHGDSVRGRGGWGFGRVRRLFFYVHTLRAKNFPRTLISLILHVRFLH